MSALISISGNIARVDKVKIAQGVVLLVIAAVAAVATAMVAVPTCIWQVLIGTVANSFVANLPIPSGDVFEVQYGQPNAAAAITGLLAALYPAYHAVWRLHEGLGYDCSVPVFCERTSRRIAAVDACLLLVALVMAFGLRTVVNGYMSGDTSAVQTACIVMFLAPGILLACAIVCPLKWLVSRGPAKSWGAGKFVPKLLRTADVALCKASSNFILLFFGELLASVLATAFLAISVIVLFFAVSLAIAAVLLAIALILMTLGLPIIIATSRNN